MLKALGPWAPGACARSIGRCAPMASWRSTRCRRLLRIMEEKGLVRHRAEGRTFVYEPTYSRDRVTSRLLHRVFDGALDQVVLSLLQAKDASEEELRGLERLIAAARKRKGSRGEAKKGRAIEMDWQILAWIRLADAAAGGLIVLAVGSLAARLCRQPVRRARLVVLALARRDGRSLPGRPAGRTAVVGRPPPGAGCDPRSRLTMQPPPSAGSPPRPPDAVEIAIAPSPPSSPERCRRCHADRPRLLGRPGRSAPAATVDSSPPRGRFCSASYFAVAAGLAAWWLVGQLLLWRVTRAARPVPKAIRDVFLGLGGPGSERVVLLESDRIALPFTYTWLRPVILLPSTSAMAASPAPSAMSWRTSGRTSKVATRWAWNLACLAGLVLFYQPLFWWLRRQLRLCQDYLADARAAAAGSADDYAAFLVRLARVRRSGPAVPGAGDRRPALEPLPEGHHARAGPRTAGAPLPGRLEPLRRHGRGRRDRRRLGAPPRCHATGRR